MFCISLGFHVYSFGKECPLPVKGFTKELQRSRKGSESGVTLTHREAPGPESYGGWLGYWTGATLGGLGLLGNPNPLEHQILESYGGGLGYLIISEGGHFIGRPPQSQ